MMFIYFTQKSNVLHYQLLPLLTLMEPKMKRVLVALIVMIDLLVQYALSNAVQITKQLQPVPQLLVPSIVIQ